MIGFFGYTGIMAISVFVGCLIRIRIIKKENKEKKTITTNFFNQEFVDVDIPYNGPDFVNRFRTDTWDLRN